MGPSFARLSFLVLMAVAAQLVAPAGAGAAQAPPYVSVWPSGKTTADVLTQTIVKQLFTP